MLSTQDLVRELKANRLATYARLRGGFPVPMAGAVYWLLVAWLGHSFELGTALFYSFLATGLIFPLAVVFAKIFKNHFLKDKEDAVGSAFVPAMIGMLLFWPMIIAIINSAPEAVILILGIGMSAHWPVIGWTYARTALYSAHSIIRAIVVLGLWLAFPDMRMVLIPLAIAAIYLLTVLAIYIDSGRVKAALAK